MAMVLVDPQPHNVKGFPVQVMDIAGRGRGLCAARNIRAGELVLCAERMGHAVRVKIEQYFCARCLRHRLPDESPPLSATCSKCRAIWVCDECNTPDFWEFHEPSCQALNVARSKKSLKTEERKLLRYLIAVVSKHWGDTKDEKGCMKCNSIKTEARCNGAHAEGQGKAFREEEGQLGQQSTESKEQEPCVGDGEDLRWQPHTCSLDDFLRMQRGPQDKRSMALFQRVASLFLESVGPELKASLRSHAETTSEASELLVEILLRDRVNVFNLADADGEEAGEMHFPAGAMLNHSCLPNVDAKLVRGNLQVLALHDIEAGQELYHAYVPLTMPAGPRSGMISDCWLFNCPCLRCTKPSHSSIKSFDLKFLCECGGATLDLHLPTDPNGSTLNRAERPVRDGEQEQEQEGADGPSGWKEGRADRRKCRCNAHNLLPDSGPITQHPAADPSLRSGSAKSRAGQRARGATREPRSTGAGAADS